MTDIIELELVEEKPVEVEIDFEGEYVSGTTGEEYGKGYDAGFTDGEKQGYNNGYAEGETQGYDKGFASGESQGYTKGETDGRQAEYNEFWDKYTINGTRKNMAYCFAGAGWDNYTFNPVRDLRPTTVNNMFESCQITDLKAILDRNNIVLDFSGVTYNSSIYIFQNSQITRVGVVDLSNVTSVAYWFYNAKNLQYIEKWKMKETQTFHSTYTFGNCSKLSHCIAEGVIGTTLNVSACPLDLESAKSFITCLKDYSGTSKEFTYEIRFSSTTKAYLEAEGATAPDGMTWLEYAQAKGWNA